MHCREMREFQLLFPSFPWLYLFIYIFLPGDIFFSLEIVNFGFTRKVLEGIWELLVWTSALYSLKTAGHLTNATFI